MLHAFENLPYVAQLVAWIIASLLLTYGIMLFTHRMISLDDRRKHHEEVGFIFSVVGIFTGLVIASVLVLAIEHYHKADAAVEREANLIGNVIRIARFTSPDLSALVNDAAQRYLAAVSVLEWNNFDTDKYIVMEAESTNKLNIAIAEYEPKTIRETNYHAALLSALDDFFAARRERAFSAHPTIALPIWIATILTGAMTIFFSLLFGHENQKLHYLMTSILAASMSVIFSLILAFDTPFRGTTAVSPQPYQAIISHSAANQAWFKNYNKTK